MQSCCRRWFCKKKKLPRPAVETTVGDRGDHWIFNAFDGSLLLPHYLDSIFTTPPLPLYLVTGFEFGLIVVPARRKAQVNKFSILR
jgi:hypothetical protein